MMFSMEKRSGRSGSGTSEESEMNRGSELVKEGVPSDEVYSAVAAVSDEIGDILKDELGDADRADRIGAELADLSAELGLLAGLADGEPQQDFPSLFDIAMGHRSSASGSSSSSWSGRRQSGRSRVPPRRRPITKCKEASRRRSAMARRAAWRGRRGPPSDASDVGADSDSEDQWTELDDASGLSDTSSGKEAAAVADVGCNDYHKEPAEAPALGQFLLPLLSAGPAPPEPDHFLIRHEDILQLLASAEDSVRDELPLEDDEAALDSQPDVLSGSDMFICEEAPVTPEEEAALLHYVCEAERDGAPAEDVDKFKPVEDWLLGVYHSWCEISALMYTLIGTEMSVETVRSEWSYRASFGCHCRLCLCLANNATALHRFLRGLVWSLAHGGNTVAATGVMRALRLRAGSTSRACEWDVARLQRLRFGDDGAAIVHEQLNRLSQQSEVTEQIVNKVCLCREHERPFEKEYAIERFCKILEHFKAASTITFKVEMSASEPADEEWVDRARRRLASFLAPQQRASTSSRLRDMAARTTPHEQSAWSGYKHRCDCLNPRTLCAQQRKQLLSDVYYRISFFGMMQAVNEFNGKTQSAENKLPNDIKPESSGRELQQGDGTGAKPPDNEQTSLVKAGSDRELSDSNGDLDDLSASESLSGSVTGSGTGSASASGSGSVSESAGASGLCGAVRRLVRSIAGIERLMDRVLRHCAACPPPAHAHRKRVDLGLSEVDRKLMAIYRRLPDVHRRQLQVYRRQKKLSTVCTQLVGGCAPAPPPPGSPPPAPPHQPCRALCPEYHLQRFKEVRRKVMHMRDQQLYYHRLRMWLEDQLRLERESLPDSNVTLVEDLPRRKRRTASPKTTRLNAAPKRKIKPVTSSINKSHKILQMLKHKLPAETNDVMKDMELNVESKDETKSEAEPPEAFPLDKEENISDTETIVGEKDNEMCKDMKDCLAKFANFALNNQEEEQVKEETKFPESMSPPLQEMSPTSSEPMPVYSPKANQRLIAVNKFLQRSEVEDTVFEFQTEMTTEVLNVPLNARRTPLLVKDESDTEMNVAEVVDCEMVVNSNKEANVDRYVTFSLEVKKAMEECQNIINSYNNIKDKKDLDKMEMMDLPLSLDHIYEVMVNLEKNAEILEKIDAEDPIDLVAANAKLSELVENMPQILANMPEIASKLSELARTPFELPEFASIMSNLPDVNNEAQLTPETLKQIRELKLNKTRDNVKVTKNTAKRKTNRRIKNNFDNSEVVGTMTFELDSKELSELLRDVKDIQNLMKNKNSKEDFKDLLFSISAQVVINKVFEYVKQNKSPEIVKCLEEDRELLGKNILVPEMYTKESTLFDNSVKDALSMDDLRELIRSRFNSWKQYVANKFKSIPIDLLENELETMLDKFQSYIQELAGKQSVNDTDKIIEKIENARKCTDGGNDSDNENCAASKESLKQITKLLSPQAGNTFDLLIMKLSKMTEDQKTTVKSLKFKYMDVVRRCIESQQLINWILSDPEIAADVILDHTGLPVKKPDNVPDFSTISLDRKKDYFTERLKEMNKIFMQTLPKKALTGDEWLVMLYRLEQLEESLKETFSKIPPPVKQNPQTQCASEAEILAAKGLSKIIGKANAARNVKKMFAASQKQVKKEEKVEVPVNKETPKENDKDEKKCKNEALLAKCEAILTSKGEKNLLDSFYTIKSYITQGLPVPDTYKKHVISICSSIDAKLLDEDIEETLKLKGEEKTDDGISELSKDKTPLSVIGSQNPELLAKYSAQALRNAKQTLNAVAFRNIMRNGQTKSESDACDTPKSDCKWTNDCVCNNCKQTDVTGSVCLGDIVKQCYDMETKSKNGLEEMKKEVKQVKPVPKQAKAQAKVCENVSHQQHVCKVGHGAGNSCAGETSSDQPCSCCYCTVFGHAPPLTTPVPRNFNETRERLRSILNKKKQKCKTSNTNGEVAEPVVERKQVTVQTQTVDVPQQPKPAKPVPPQPKPATPQPKPPTLPKTLPPASTSSPVQPKRQTPDEQQRQLADKMAKMTVSEKPDNKPKATQHTVTIQTNVLTSLKTDGKVNPNAMEQIRIQQLKQQHIQQQQMQHHQQMFQQQILQQQQKKPEPIYDLPIHNKPTLTPQQQQQIRQQQLQQQQQQQQQLQQQQQQQQQHQQQQQMQQQAQLQQQRQQQQQQLLQQQQQIQQQQLQQKQQQEQQQQQQQQQLQQQQQMQQQRQGRPQQQKAAVSLSSRDTSVFSTSSGCSGGSFWRCGRAEDPRDLDALLQYIEGPQRHVDRGKKRAKKQRQRAKKMESRLLEHQSALLHEMAYARGMAASFRVTLQAATRQAQNAREALAPYRAKKKGKILKLNPAIQAKVQLLTEQLSKVNMFITTTAKEIQAAERQEAEARRRLDQCEKELEEARAIQGKQDWPDQQQNQNADEQVNANTQTQELQKTQKQHLDRQCLQNFLEQKDAVQALGGGDGTGVVRVRRAGTGGVTLSVGGRADVPLAQLLQASGLKQTGSNAHEEPAPQQKPDQPQRKQTWEQALAHINQIAKGSNKDKKKQKGTQAAKAEVKQNKEQQKSQTSAEPPTLSKKQRKLLAKQQAEEEEKKKQQEAEAKKKDKKTDPPKAEPVNKKVEKKLEVKTEEKAKKKECKKQEKAEKKGKENKQEKNVTVPAAKAKQPTNSNPPQSNKKEKKKEQQQQQKQDQQKPQVINITADTTIEVVNKKSPCPTENEKPASCSIMEQLSSGVQVADLKLPPGITLTRVQPSEKKEAPPLKSVPLWRCSALAAPPTPAPRPPPVITADPAASMFTTTQPEAPKTVIVPEPPPPQPAPTGKSKKAKKKAKKAAAAAAESENKQDGAKMVTLRNPMFHPNLPSVQITNAPQKKAEIRIPDPIPMPPTACQATITPTSNGMYTIRNPLMSMMHQQSLMGLRTPTPVTPMNTMFTQPQYTYVNPNVYNPVQTAPTQAYVLDPSRNSPKNQESDFQNRIMNLASFTQKSEDGYSLFNTPDDNQQRSFLTPEYYEETPKPVVSPNPIGTRPNVERNFENESLFANPIQRPEPIGTPLRREETNDFTGSLYTPFGQEDRNVFRNALFNDKADTGPNLCKAQDVGFSPMANGDSLPYFQRLRVGSKLNNEVTIHHVTESKFYKGQEGPQSLDAQRGDESLFSRPSPPVWPDSMYTNCHNHNTVNASSASSPAAGSVLGSPAPTPSAESPGAVGERAYHAHHESSVFLPDNSITNLSALEAAEREIESFKRFDFYFEPPRHKPRVQLDVNALRPAHK